MEKFSIYFVVMEKQAKDHKRRLTQKCSNSSLETENGK